MVPEREPTPERVGAAVDLFADPVATRPEPELGLSWPDAEALGEAGAVLARPDPVFAPEVFRMVADPALWVDVPDTFRTRSVAQQRDDLRRFAAHWRRHGFGYWLLWSDRGRTGPSSTGDDLLGLGGLRWMWWRDTWVLNVLVRLAVHAQGRGLATRLLETAIDRVDAAVDVPTTVVARTRPTNEAMAGLARRLGFDEAGTQRRELGTYRVLERTVGR